MVGVLQGCVIGLIVLCINAQKEKLQISVPSELEIHKGEEARFAIAYYPNSTNDDIQITVNKRISRLSEKRDSVLNITAGNSSTPTVYLASAMRNTIQVTQHYNRFYVTFKSVQLNYRGDYVIKVAVNDEEKEAIMSLHVLEKPTAISIELHDPSFLPYEEDTVVNFTCTVNGGMDIGEVTLARKSNGDASYFPLESDLVDTTSNDFSKIYNYTFERVLNHNDNGSDYACEVYEGAYIIPNGHLLRSKPVNVAVSFSGTTLTITPNEVQIGGANPTTLNGTCIPPTQARKVFTITIGRKRLSSVQETPMVEIALTDNNNQPSIMDPTLSSRLTIQGDITNDQKNLRFSLKDPTCNDIKDYTFYCKTQISPDNSEIIKEDFKNVTYRVNPDKVKMILFPANEIFTPGTLATFTCTGLIGSNFPTDQSNFWIWEWRDVSQIIPTSWTRYPSPANITYGTPTAAANCNYNGRSELKHTVTDFDVGRQFRCYIVNSDLYSANVTIRTESLTTIAPGASSNNGPASADLGMILGIVFGLLAAIVIVVVLVYFLVFRRKNSGGDDYDTGEGKENGPEMVDNVVYTTPSSKPHRGRGRENDGMDEPHEKNPRPYYANDFNDRDRGRSNPAMDNDSRHDRSFDDDNTDSRMRSPYGSAV